MKNNNLHIDTAAIARFFAGEASSSERERVLLWKDESPENKMQFDDFQEVWSIMDKTSPQSNINIDAEWKILQSTLKQSDKAITRTFTLRPILRIAASILIIIGLSYSGWLFYNNKSVQSPIAETNSITLPDGSLVTLNAASKLTYTKVGWDKRRVVSLNGEAFFEVTKNPRIPFIIRANGAEVKVLGTSFNVKAYKNDSIVEVTVKEGVVSVYEHRREDKNLIITKGEKAIFNNIEKTIIKQTNEDKNVIAWKTRTMVFENDSLQDVVKTLQNVYHIGILIQSPEIKHCTITTIFDNKDIETVMKVLKSTLDVTIEVRDEKIFIRGKGC